MENSNPLGTISALYIGWYIAILAASISMLSALAVYGFGTTEFNLLIATNALTILVAQKHIEMTLFNLDCTSLVIVTLTVMLLSLALFSPATVSPAKLFLVFHMISTNNTYQIVREDLLNKKQLAQLDA